jgi:DNA polymerase-3 subunit gamma/tau
MAYLVLARKYRPQRFSDVAGQDHVTRTLLNALAQQRIAHGYIFSGHRGIGKTTIARILAMALNCRTEIGTPERPTPEPCGICESCTEIRAGNSTDVIEIDAATNRGIDEIRELRDAARYRPSRDRYKIYILDEAHQITDAAFNALLKTLEEPPDHVIFMMATTQPEDIPQTIRSRCQHFSFHAVSFEQIVEQLTGIAAHEGIAVDDATLGLLAEAGDGSMRDALSIMDQAIASAPTGEDGKPHLSADQIRDLMGNVPSNVFEQVLEAVSANDGHAVLVEVNRLLNAGHSPQQLARQMVRYLRNCVMAKLAGESSELLQVSADERKRAGRTAMLFSEEDLTRFLQIMLRTFDDLGYRQEQRFHFELGLLKLVHAQRLLPLEQMLSPMAATAQRATPPVRQATPIAPPRPPVAPPSQSRPAAPAVSESASPFEQDRRRKDTHSPTMESSAPAPKAVTNSAPVAVASAPERTEGSLALAPQPVDTEPLPAEAAPQPKMVVNPAGDAAVRSAIVQALVDAGQSSAAQLLSEANWTETEREWRVEVAVSEKTLPIAINSEARKLAERILREGNVQPGKIAFVGAGTTKPASKAAALPLPAGGVHQLARENQLVQKAQDLFQAEIRDVVDLRDRSR